MTNRIRNIAAAMIFAAGSTVFGVEEATWDHVHLMAPDMAEAAQWHSKYFGGEVGKAGSFDAVFHPNCVIKFKKTDTELKGSAGSSVDHIGYSVEDTAAKLKELEEAGVKVVQPLKHSRRGGFDYAFVEDPWGTKVEIINDPDILGFHHVHVTAVDPVASLDWYASVFGGEVTRFKGLPNLPVIRYGDMLLLAMKVDEPSEGTAGHSVDHLGWKVKDMEAFVANADSLGAEFDARPSKHKTNIGGFVLSPTGTRIEIQQPLETE